jgi:ubiquinone/menaquinone biosynthesis C-methylase UbiE
MSNPLDFVPLIFGQLRGRHELARRPEPDALTDDADHVFQYDQVRTTKLVIAYAIGMEAVHRARTAETGAQGKALDLACGPGHFTIWLREQLHYRDVTGVDLAPNMIRTAQKNVRARNLDSQVRFLLGDITKLDQFAADTFDLSTFTDAAHHMPDLGTVGRVLAEMDRITRPDGLVMLMDLARLRTAALTERYVKLLGGDYRARGLNAFFDDFRNSMYAAWTCAELATAIPRNSRRTWCHFASKTLPTLQIVLGLPVERDRPFVRRGFPWRWRNRPVPKDSLVEWLIARTDLFLARPSFVARRIV